MVFSSLVFLFGFLPLFLLAYRLTPGLRARNIVLTATSFVFYGWWRPDFVLLMAFSTVLDWWCSLRMGAIDDGRRRKPWLILSVVTNLALLGWFKYANFCVDVLHDLGTGPSVWKDVVLPVGISFYTFQSMSYTIDVYRGEVKPVRSLLDLACYVSMFPQLVAGPIVRYRDVQEQVTERSTSIDDFAAGVLLFMIGMSKKVLIADHAALLATPVFATHAPGLIDSWIGALAYSIQIYFDFSGYSDMAVGLGLMIGFRFPHNFLSPYKSQSITEFWRRWHVSLSTWLRDYLYIPLGGNQRGTVRTYVNLSATMLLGGLWHGAAYNFVIWGAYQGAWLVVERAAGKRALWHALPFPLRVAVTFAVVLGGWAVFAASSMHGVLAMWGGMLGVAGAGQVPVASSHAIEAWAAVGLGCGLAFFAPHSWIVVRRFHGGMVLFLGACFLLSIGLLAARSHVPFLYFRF
ncbi:MAG: MBOAT family protein [Planctomycetota bacterium]